MRTTRATNGAVDVDVAIVGYGPVGQALAGWLGRAGHRVAAFERFQEIYRLPRAVHLDHEVMRLLQSLGLADELEPEFVPVHDYEWFGADGEPLMTLAAPTPAVSGWASDYMFFQPVLEDALDRCARSHPTVTVERGWIAEALVNSAAGAELTVRRVEEDERGGLVATGETRTVRARWVIGADGANSFVRDACGITRRDLGFQERWLVVDVEPRAMAALAHLPVACQWCDPARPTTHVRSGPRHHRWEFMLLPGETAAEFEDPARVWALLERWYRPQDGPVTRSAVYEFRSMLAEQMRDRRVLLAGDAAHLTPPFLGQGLCSGLRDAANVAWKLDLVLRGLALESLLDTVDAERQPVNVWVINFAIQLGKVLCELDPTACAERDAGMRAAGVLPPLELAPIAGGLLHRVPEGGASDPLAGKLGLQGHVAVGGTEGRFDDVVGGGFTLIVASGDPVEALDLEQRSLLAALRITLASLDPAAPTGIDDLDGRLTTWLREHGTYAVLVRPDFYVFGSAASPEELPALLDDLRTQLGVHIPSTRITKAPTMPDSTAVIHPTFHHVNLKTTRLQEMIEFYRRLIGVEVIHQDGLGAWMTNDEANHRVALLAFPNFVDDPEKENRTGMHHSAFEYDSFEDLNASYLRLRHEGIEPAICLDHGMTLSYYYSDPDGNNIELQVDCFGDWAKSKEWMRTSETFRANPIGQFVRPDLIAAEHANGMSFTQIHEKAMNGGYAPEQAPVEVPEMTT